MFTYSCCNGYVTCLRINIYTHTYTWIHACMHAYYTYGLQYLQPWVINFEGLALLQPLLLRLHAPSDLSHSNHTSEHSPMLQLACTHPTLHMYFFPIVRAEPANLFTTSVYLELTVFNRPFVIRVMYVLSASMERRSSSEALQYYLWQLEWRISGTNSESLTKSTSRGPHWSGRVGGLSVFVSLLKEQPKATFVRGSWAARRAPSAVEIRRLVYRLRCDSLIDVNKDVAIDSGLVPTSWRR